LVVVQKNKYAVYRIGDIGRTNVLPVRYARSYSKSFLYVYPAV